MDAIDLICGYEGFRSEAYDDGAGYLTIGYGSRFWQGQPVTDSYPGTVTEAQARQEMIPVVQRLQTQIISALAPYTPTDGQLAALCSFSYNVGIGAFERSSVCTYLKAGDVEDAANSLLQWNKAGGRIVQGLVNRRAQEREVFLS